MTAQLECLLDDVVVGKQEMVGAIDAVCDVALRIIGKLTQGPCGRWSSVAWLCTRAAVTARAHLLPR